MNECICPDAKCPEHGRIYPCANCGTLRTKDEGGAVFTVCDECWDEHYKTKSVRKEEAMSTLHEAVVKFLTEHSAHAVMICPSTPNEDVYADSLLALLAQHGVVQVIEGQDRKFITEKDNVRRVRPISEGR